VTAVKGELPRTDDSPKYGGTATTAKIVGWVKDNAVVRQGKLAEGDEAGLLLDRTSFYPEQGGQVGDAGVCRTASGTFEIDDTQKLGDAVLHLGRVTAGGNPGRAAGARRGGGGPGPTRRPPPPTPPRRPPRSA